MFCDIVENYTRFCRYANNQWHVPDYGGIEAARGVQTLNGSGVQRVAKVDNEEHLKQLLAHSRDTMTQMRRIAEAQELPQLPAPPELAHVKVGANRSPADAMQSSMPSADACGQSILKEVWSDSNGKSKQGQTRANKG